MIHFLGNGIKTAAILAPKSELRLPGLKLRCQKNAYPTFLINDLTVASLCASLHHLSVVTLPVIIIAAMLSTSIIIQCLYVP